jgi:hypothetical protein
MDIKSETNRKVMLPNSKITDVTQLSKPEAEKRHF